MSEKEFTHWKEEVTSLKAQVERVAGVVDGLPPPPPPRALGFHSASNFRRPESEIYDCSFLSSIIDSEPTYDGFESFLPTRSDSQTSSRPGVLVGYSTQRFWRVPPQRPVLVNIGAAVRFHMKGIQDAIIEGGIEASVLSEQKNNLCKLLRMVTKWQVELVDELQVCWEDEDSRSRWSFELLAIAKFGHTLHNPSYQWTGQLHSPIFSRDLKCVNLRGLGTYVLDIAVEARKIVEFEIMEEKSPEDIVADIVLRAEAIKQRST